LLLTKQTLDRKSIHFEYLCCANFSEWRERQS
jgi:hypothetical protein